MTTPTITLRAIESVYLGGQSVWLNGLPTSFQRTAMGAPAREVDPNGEHTVGQIYAQHYALAEPRHPFPVLLWHGGGMTGGHWESTPDGRPGWLWRFLSAGFDVWVSDAPERGRASWAMYPQVYTQEPIFRTKDEAWKSFRIGRLEEQPNGAMRREPFPGQRFPVGAFDAFAKQWVPRWTGHESMTLAGYDALIRHVGPCLVVGHSQGGGFAVAAAQRHPNHVQAVVAIEPSGLQADAQARVCPHLAIWGDYVEADPTWNQARQRVLEHWQTANANGNKFDICDLPSISINGNSHFPMADNNSDAIADIVIRWLAQRSHPHQSLIKGDQHHETQEIF